MMALLEKTIITGGLAPFRELKGAGGRVPLGNKRVWGGQIPLGNQRARAGYLFKNQKIQNRKKQAAKLLFDKSLPGSNLFISIQNKNIKPLWQMTNF